MLNRFVFAALAALASFVVAAEERYTLAQLLGMARQSNSTILITKDQVDAAAAGLATAGAYPNPELEALGGGYHPRQTDVHRGNLQSYTLTQRVDWPAQRQARKAIAAAHLDASHAQVRVTETEVVARVKLRFYDLLRRQAEAAAARLDLALMGDIRRRVELRVTAGEAPRYELIKAEAEFLNAQKTLQTSEYRLEQALTYLRREVGSALPARFSVNGELDAPSPLPSLDTLRQALLARNPELVQARAENTRADSMLELERRRRMPELALKVGADRDPETTSSRLGVVVTVPLWDRRAGPIGEAAANARRARHERDLQEFALLQALEAAWHQYAIAQSQLIALEGGIIREAEAALKVAEAAYRFGERGILDYLDAQRVFRAARNDLIAARFELRSADIEIARLLAAD